MQMQKLYFIKGKRGIRIIVFNDYIYHAITNTNDISKLPVKEKHTL